MTCIVTILVLYFADVKMIVAHPSNTLVPDQEPTIPCQLTHRSLQILQRLDDLLDRGQASRILRGSFSSLSSSENMHVGTCW